MYGKIATSMALVASGFLATLAHAGTLQCNKQQTKCQIENRDLTIGDLVGVFNDDGELIATGEVKAMRGDRRSVRIKQRHGTIRHDDQLALLGNQASDIRPAATYKVYKEPAKRNAGASLGYSSVSVGDGSPGTELTGFMQWRKWGGLQLIGRGLYAQVEGEVTRYGDNGSEALPISVSTLGLLGGAGYVIRDNKPLGFRGEAAVGLARVDATIGGDSSLVDGEMKGNAKVRNGYGAIARWSLGLVWNLSEWHLHADYAQSLVHQALSNTIALGFSSDME